MIRIAKGPEIRQVAEFMKQFEQASSFVKVDVDHTTKAYENLINQNIAVFFMLLDENEKLIGGLGALKYPDIHSGVMTAVECFWFVAPEHRGGTGAIKLLKAFEQWAKKEGCKKAAMIHLTDSMPDKLERLYDKFGYSLIEKHYVKEIQCQ